MRKIFLFMMVSLDGFFEGVDHDLSWHNVDSEFNEFAIAQLKEIDTIIFGSKTYEMMASYWPTEGALRDDPVVANLMNETPKIVFSQTLESIDWNNTTLLKDIKKLEELKQQEGKDMAIFGSNNLTVSLIKLGLVDEFRIMVNPVVIGDGDLLFKGLEEKLNLKLLNTRKFNNGNVLLYYQPTK